MDRSALRNSLLQLIDEETQLAHQLSRSLADETEALRAVSPQELDRVTDEKHRCVQHLAACDAQRQQLCTVLGVPSDLDGMQMLLKRADDPALQTQWQSLLALLETCREANTRNGAVVTMQRRRVADALGLIHGEPAQNSLYDAQGEIGENDSSRVNTTI
ncbi:MAG: flagellar protein FlgN [Gammaproteobacteria bacterium]|nr:flagellar protein FlgN [Gammaproteobacteria bacterium]NND59474.1 flagellar protein FlgN [Gammaproteobacteria bacterium]